DSYRDADYVSIFGMRPSEWHMKGVRLLGRTAVECTRDELADAIARDVAGTVALARGNAGVLVIDPFAGSANTLYWLLRHLPRSQGRGFELDASVCCLTQQNLEVLAQPIEILNTDYRSGLDEISVEADKLVITYIAPPWGDALRRISGLDLRRTLPPVTAIVDFLVQRFSEQGLLCAVQIYETVDPDSLTELKSRFDWSTMRVYSLNKPGENHGILIGTKGWAPSVESRLA